MDRDVHKACVNESAVPRSSTVTVLESASGGATRRQTAVSLLFLAILAVFASIFLLAVLSVFPAG
jgi:hypothetical protein